MKLFTGFALDMASDFCGLSKGEIKWLVSQKVVAPKKDKTGSFVYSFSELLMLRLIKLLKDNGVRVKNVKKAREYLKDIDPNHDLTNIQLYVRSDRQQILYLGEDPQDNTLVNMSEFGQLVGKNLLHIIPVGKKMESMRREVIDLDSTLSERLNVKKLIPAKDLLRKYGMG